MIRKAILVPLVPLLFAGCVDVEGVDDVDDLATEEAELIGPGDGEPDCAIPATPTLAVQSTAATSVTLLASSTCDNAGSVIDRRLGTTGAWVRLSSPPLWGTPYVSQGLTPQTQYCWRVIANIGTQTRTSGIQCATTRMAPPVAPSNITIRSITATSMTLDFTDRSTTEDGFRVYHRAGTGYDAPTLVTTTSKVGTGAVRTLALTPTGTGNGYGTHCYSVAAYHADGQTYGPEVCAKLQNLDDPPAAAAEWRFRPEIGATEDLLLPRRRGSFINDGAWAYLHYYSRLWGVSLGWDDDYDWYDFEIERAPASSFAPVVDGELVAIKVDGGGYLKYESRSWGINLGFSSTPRYEWRLRRVRDASGDREGYPLTGSYFALSNSVANDFLVYDTRSNGIDLRWYRDTLEEQAPPPGMQLITDSIFLNASNQNGYVVWSGGIGGSFDDGELENLALPSTTNLLGFFFLKGNASGSTCVTANTTNGVYVAAGQAMTASQKVTLFGTDRPSIPLTLRGCACLANNCPLQWSQQTPPPPAIVNVEWIAN